MSDLELQHAIAAGIGLLIAMIGLQWAGDDERDYGDEEDRRMPDGTTFANPGSALRAATARNPRNLPCGSCGEPDRLTPADRRAGYQCDSCADRDEGAYGGGDY